MPMASDSLMDIGAGSSMDWDRRKMQVGLKRTQDHAAVIDPEDFEFTKKPGYCWSLIIGPDGS